MKQDEAVQAASLAWEWVPNVPALGFSQQALTPEGLVKALVALGVLKIEPGAANDK